METEQILASLGENMDRLNAAASMLERAVAWMEEKSSASTGAVEKMTAAVESHSELLQRERELQKKLEIAEQKIAALQAQESKAAVRQTLPASTTQLLAKQGISTMDSIQAGALDTALTGLSLEQRIAVKAQLLRAGMLAQ